MSRALHAVLGVLAVAALALITWQIESPTEIWPPEEADCKELPEHRGKKGTQGWRTWSDEGLRAFDHKGAYHCVPQGWSPVGTLDHVGHRARWNKKQTAVLVADKVWNVGARSYSTDFEVRLFWPKALGAKLFEQTDALLAHAFEEIGRLFPPLPDALKSEHHVLVTAGHAGHTRSYDTRIYPEPGPDLSVVVRDPQQSRGHELTIHAIAHLHNRHRVGRADGVAPPIPQKDWEELVATWTETAFIRSHRGRMKRLEYLYNVHTAVQTGDHDLITGPPFDDAERFWQITPNVVVAAGQPSIDMQYGHYILAPLAMVGTEGLLARAGVEDTMVEILRDTFHGSEDFFGEVEERLGPAGLATLEGWLHGGETIDADLVWAGAERYRDRYQRVGSPTR